MPDFEAPDPDSTQASVFLALVEQHESRLRGAVRCMGIDQSTADDILQDALLVAWNRFESDLHEAAFPAWVLGIARRLLLNLRRRGARRWNLLQNEVVGFLAARRSPQPDMLQAASGKEEIELIRICLEELDESSRRVVQQRYFEQLTPAEIAGIEGTNSNAVRQQLHRVRQRLAKSMRQKLGGDTDPVI